MDKPASLRERDNVLVPEMHGPRSVVEKVRSTERANTFHSPPQCLLPDLYLALVTAQRNNSIMQSAFETTSSR